jgi:hypothetical protein
MFFWSRLIFKGCCKNKIWQIEFWTQKFEETDQIFLLFLNKQTQTQLNLNYYFCYSVVSFSFVKYLLVLLIRSITENEFVTAHSHIE